MLHISHVYFSVYYIHNPKCLGGTIHRVNPLVSEPHFIDALSWSLHPFIERVGGLKETDDRKHSL